MRWLLRDEPSDCVLPIVKSLAAPRLFHAICLMVGAGTPVLAEPPRLPTGQGDMFRERMMAWTAQPPAPSRPVLQTEQEARIPLISSPFGRRRDPINGGAGIHAGIDIPGRLGTPVVASATGTVRFAGHAGGYGTMIEIDHGDGLVTRYAHLSERLVTAGDQVAQGQTIGLMGSTGRSTGSHLHFEVRMHGAAVPPSGYFHVDAPRAPRADSRPEPVPHISDYARRRAAAAQAEGSTP